MDAQTRKHNLDAVLLLNVVFVVLVLLLHHGQYTYDFIKPLRALAINRYLQKVAVGGFLFLSGYKLTKSKLATPSLDFLKNRFLRIYPLYFIALLVYTFTVYVQKHDTLPTLKTFFVHVFLLQTVVPELFGRNYLTIWFVSVLLFCYLFFLAMRRLLVTNLMAYGVMTLSVCLGVCLIRAFFAERDIIVFMRFFEVYLSFFAVGMTYAIYEQAITRFFCRKSVAIAYAGTFTALLTLLMAVYIQRFNSMDSISLRLFEFLAILLTTIPLYFYAFTNASRLKVNRMTTSILLLGSSGSFCIFLFHRPVWSVMVEVWSNRSVFQALYILVMGIPLIVFCSCQIQRSYNNILKKLSA
ncbi:MAG: acyltransferase [Cyanobacteria bacterium J06623_5]